MTIVLISGSVKPSDVQLAGELWEVCCAAPSGQVSCLEQATQMSAGWKVPGGEGSSKAPPSP